MARRKLLDDRVTRRLERALLANARWHDAQLWPANRSVWLRPLQRWQSARLEASFEDFMQAPDTRAATQFFLSDLYGDQDVSRRDAQVERVVPLMQRLLPAPLLSTVADAIELAALSHALDLRVAAALEAAGLPAREDALSVAQYAAAYRAAGCPRLRRYQVELITRIGVTLGAAVKKAWLARLLRLSRLPARAAGLQELQKFLERGFAAFLEMQDPAAFMRAVAERELDASEKMFAGDPEPFGKLRIQLNSRSRY